MRNNDIRITLSGSPASGKNMFLAHIATILRAQGFHFTYDREFSLNVQEPSELVMKLQDKK